MNTIFRVKRRREEEPSDGLLITCKKTKQSDEEAGAVPTVTALLKFVGTVDKQDDNVREHIPEKLRKEDLKANYKQHIVNIKNKLREKHKERTSENRLKVVNSKRDLIEENLKIIDIEDANPSKTDNTDPYVYDLYFSNTNEDLPLDNLESIETFKDELVFDDCYKDDEEDSDDSNAESNWRNDYPDSENSDDTIGEEDIRNAIKSMNIDEQSSSDEDFVYGLDKDDVERYGHKYAKYKARIKRENDGHYDSDSQEDESDDNEDGEDDDDDDYN